MSWLFRWITLIAVLVTVGAILWSALVSNDSADAIRALSIAVVGGVVCLLAWLFSLIYSNSR